MNVRGILITLLILSTVIMVSGVDVRATPAVWTVGVGGDFQNVTDAFSSGLLIDGDVLVFISDVSDYWGLTIDTNVSIVGGWYTWHLINNTPGESNGVYVLDRPENPTSFSISNVTILVESPNINCVIWTNASDFSLTNVGFVATGSSYSWRNSIYGLYSSQTVSINIKNFFDNGSVANAVYLDFYGTSVVNIYIDGFYSLRDSVIGDGDLYIHFGDQSLANAYLSNLYFNNTKYGVTLDSYDSSIVNMYINGLGTEYVLYDAISLDLYGDSAYIEMNNVWIQYSDGYGIDVYEYTASGGDIVINNVVIDYAEGDGGYFDLYSDSESHLYINNFVVNYAEYPLEVYGYPLGNLEVELYNIFINESYSDSIYIDSEPGGYSNIIMDSVVVNYSGGEAVSLFGYADLDSYMSISNIYLGYTADDSFVLYDYTIGDVDISISHVYANRSDDDFMYLDIEPGGTASVGLMDLYVNYSYSSGVVLDIYPGIDLYLSMENIYINYSGYNAIYAGLYSSVLETVYADISNLYVGYSDLWALYIDFYSVYGYLNISRVYIGEAGVSRTESIWIYLDGSYYTALLQDTYIKYAHWNAITVYTNSHESSIVLKNIYIGGASGNGLRFMGPTRVFSYNDVSLYNVWVGSTGPGNYAFIMLNTSNMFDTLVVEHSVFNGTIYLSRVNNAWFIDTYFNESGSDLYLSIVNITWTLDIYAVSTYTGLPIPGVYVTIYNDTELLAAGYTGSDGHFRYCLSYTINDVLRTSPYLSAVASIQNSIVVWNNTGGFSLPGWYSPVVLELNYTLIRVTGVSSDGITTLVLDGKTGCVSLCWYMDPTNPSKNRIEKHPVRVLSSYESNNITIFNIMICFNVAGKKVWLPAQLIIDSNTGTVFLTGPITLYARI